MNGATIPFWAPDSQSVSVFADGKLKRLTFGAVYTAGVSTEVFGKLS